MIPRFQHHDFAAGRNAEQTSIHAHRGAKKTSADPFLPSHLAGGGVETSDDAVVTPQEQKRPHGDTRWHIRCGPADFISQFGFFPCGRIARPHRHQIIAAAAAAARADDQPRSNDRRTDAAFVEGFVIFPQHLAVVRIDGADAVGQAVENQRRFLPWDFVKAWGRVIRPGGAPGRFPAGLSGAGIDCD